MNDASPRKRAESSGSLFGGSDEEEETGGRNIMVEIDAVRCFAKSI